MQHEYLQTQADLVTVTSHIAHHTRVSSAFTCSSLQQGLYAAVSVGRRGSKCIQRAPAETTEPRVLLLPLCSWPGGGEHQGCWWRRVSGFKRAGFFCFFSSPFSTPTGSRQIQTQHRAVRAHLCRVCLLSHLEQNLNKAFSVCVAHIQVASGESHALFSSPPDPTRVYQTAEQIWVCVCLDTCACVYTVLKCV